MRFNVDDLVRMGYVQKKTYHSGDFAGLSILKYKNNVFWGNLWEKDHRLVDCRGMVTDQHDNIVIHPFTKVFNHMENGTTTHGSHVIDLIQKVNGFMASAGHYNGSLLVSTTGTLDSDFARLAKKHIEDSCLGMVEFLEWLEVSCATTLFEICDLNDPHVVPEEPGAYLIGIRLRGGAMASEASLDAFAERYGFKRPAEKHYGIPFSEALKLAKTCKHEGYMVRSPDTGETILKLKSAHYLATKFLMRGGMGKWDLIWDNKEEAKKRVDEEFYALLDQVRWAFTKEEWNDLHQQDRRSWVERYFEEHC